MSEEWKQRDYLRDVQYRDAQKLFARANLHRKHSTNTEGFLPWLASLVDWPVSCEVLDVGCGPGWFWSQSANVVPPRLRLTLSDLSPGMVHSANERVRTTTNHVVIDALEADAQQLPFADESFDVVVANFMLYHVPDPTLAIKEFARVLRGDGTLLTATNGPGNLEEMNAVVAKVFGRSGGTRSIEAFGSETGGVLLAAGFDEVRWHRYDDTIRCSNVADVIAYVTSSPPGENANDEQLRLLREEFETRVKAGGGVMTITKNTGAFVSKRPRRSSRK